VGQFVEEFFGERVLGDIFSNLGGQISKFGDIYKISHANIKFLKTFGGTTHQRRSAPEATA
jgi:hypothetical protein